MAYFRRGEFLILLLFLILLAAGGQTIYSAFGNKAEDVPDFTVQQREESDGVVQVHYVIEGSGSADAKKMAAASFKRLSDTYNAIALKITDRKDEEWYGVYMENENAVRGLHTSMNREMAEIHQQLKQFHNGLEKHTYPVIEFSKEPILE
ncbi:hypothetical protein V1498_13210 [Peribacillus sp. SCS-26]|uniref:hypothetical protein n=1 Tax=Paraperibacillus marinus TaxID=3115295 RepID=UPI003905E12C